MFGRQIEKSLILCGVDFFLTGQQKTALLNPDSCIHARLMKQSDLVLVVGLGSSYWRELLGGSQVSLHISGENSLEATEIAVKYQLFLDTVGWRRKNWTLIWVHHMTTISNSNNCKFNKTVGFQETLLHCPVAAWNRVITGNQLSLQQRGRRKNQLQTQNSRQRSRGGRSESSKGF